MWSSNLYTSCSFVQDSPNSNKLFKIDGLIVKKIFQLLLCQSGMIELYAVYRDSRNTIREGRRQFKALTQSPHLLMVFFFLMKFLMALLLYVKAQNFRIMLKISQIYVSKAHKLMTRQVTFSIFWNCTIISGLENKNGLCYFFSPLKRSTKF